MDRSFIEFLYLPDLLVRFPVFCTVSSGTAMLSKKGTPSPSTVAPHPQIWPSRIKFEDINAPGLLVDSGSVRTSSENLKTRGGNMYEYVRIENEHPKYPNRPLSSPMFCIQHPGDSNHCAFSVMARFLGKRSAEVIEISERMVHPSVWIVYSMVFYVLLHKDVLKTQVQTGSKF